MFSTKYIKNIRTTNNKTQEEIAKLMNVTRSSYAMWESENNIFPIKRLLEFCYIFKVSIDYALGLTSKNIHIFSKYNKKLSQERLKSFRKEKHLTQQELANILNTYKSVVSRFENGKNIIATPFLYIICKKYNISADYLLGRIDTPKYLIN